MDKPHKLMVDDSNRLCDECGAGGYLDLHDGDYRCLDCHREHMRNEYWLQMEAKHRRKSEGDAFYDYE